LPRISIKKKLASNTFDNISSSEAQFVTTSPFASARYNSAENTYRTAEVLTLASVRLSSLYSSVVSDFSKLGMCGDLHQYTKLQERRKSGRSSHSENASIRSGTSSTMVKGTQQGFICNQYLIRDLLHCLKECLVETSAAFYRSLTADNVDIRKVEVVSSVEPELLQQRMNR
jgi:Ca2+-dependent lipid-binding protein